METTQLYHTGGAVNFETQNHTPAQKKKETRKQESNGMTARGLSLGMSSQIKNVRCLVGNSVWALSIIFDQSLAGR